MANSENPTGGERRVAGVHASGSEDSPDIAINDAGQFVIVWEGFFDGPGTFNDDLQGVFARTFNADGTTNSDVFRANVDGDFEDDPAVGIDGDGNVYVAWDAFLNPVQLRKFDFDGTPLTNTLTLPFNSRLPSIDTREDGLTALTFTTTSNNGDEDVLLLVLNSDLQGNINLNNLPFASESQQGNQRASSVTFNDDDSIIVAWEGESNTSSDSEGVFYRTFEAVPLIGPAGIQQVGAGGEGIFTTQVVSNEMTINQTLAGDQESVSLAALDGENWVAVWSGNGVNDDNGVFARQFGTPITLDLDFDDSTTTGNDFAAEYFSGTGPIQIVDSDFLITSESEFLSFINVSITNLADPNFEILSVDTTGTMISQSFSGGFLTLSGNDTLENYEQVLSTLTYENNSANPTASVREILFFAQNAIGGGNASAMSFIDVITPQSLNVDPLATNLVQTIVYDEDQPAVSLADIVVTDPNVGDVITVTLDIDDVNTGSLSTNSGNGETYDPNTGIWTITGDVATVNAALADVEFIPTANNEAPTAISVQIVDSFAVVPLFGTINLSVTPNDDPPFKVNNFAPVFFPDFTSNVISQMSLQFQDDNHVDPADIIYELRSLPEIGDLRLASSSVPLAIGDTFTQLDIINDQLVYDPDGDLLGTESLDLIVSDGSQSMDTVFEIVVGNTIERGDTGSLIGSDIDDSDIVIVFDDVQQFRLQDPPPRGNLFRAGDPTPLGLDDTFTVAEIEAGLITYDNDGVNADDDFFVVEVFETDGDTYFDTIEIRVVDSPVLDLDADDSGPVAGTDFATTYEAGDPFIAVTDSDVSVLSLIHI